MAVSRKRASSKSKSSKKATRTTTKKATKTAVKKVAKKSVKTAAKKSVKSVTTAKKRAAKQQTYRDLPPVPTAKQIDASITRGSSQSLSKFLNLVKL